MKECRDSTRKKMKEKKKTGAVKLLEIKLKYKELSEKQNSSRKTGCRNFQYTIL